METDNFKTKVEEPTEWVNSTVVSLKEDKIYLDPNDLHTVITRVHYPVRSVENVVREMPNAKIILKTGCKKVALYK